MLRAITCYNRISLKFECPSYSHEDLQFIIIFIIMIMIIIVVVVVIIIIIIIIISSVTTHTLHLWPFTSCKSVIAPFYGMITPSRTIKITGFRASTVRWQPGWTAVSLLTGCFLPVPWIEDGLGGHDLSKINPEKSVVDDYRGAHLRPFT